MTLVARGGWSAWRRTGHPSDGDLNDVVDGIVPIEQRALVEDHTRTCDACGNDVRALSDLKIAARASAVDIQAPPTLWHAVAAATIYASAHSAYMRRTFRWRRAVLIVAVAAASSLAAALLLDQTLQTNVSATIRAGRKRLSHLGRSQPTQRIDQIRH